jgi:ABC-type multidrug transport system ATPase subunit
MPTLQVHHLHHAFGAREVLRGIDLTLPPGQVVGLLGPNGAGKSTLLRILTGFERPTAGTCGFEGEALEAAARRALCAFLPDGIAPWPDHRVEALLAHLARLHGVPGAEAPWITDLDLAAFRTRPLGELSKGQRKRVLLAATLLQPKPWVILDEPFDGLDLRQVGAASALLAAQAALGRGILVCLHDLALAARACHRFALLQEGRLVATGTVAELQVQAGLQGTLEEVILALT